MFSCASGGHVSRAAQRKPRTQRHTCDKAAATSSRRSLPQKQSTPVATTSTIPSLRSTISAACQHTHLVSSCGLSSSGLS